MKPANLVKTCLIGLVALSLSNCFPDNVTVYDGPPVVEWQPPDRATNALNLTTTLEADQQEAEDITLRVQVIGPHENYDRVIYFSVDEEQSDAQEGVHFDILNDAYTSVIPANSSFGDIDIRIYAEQIENRDELEATLLLHESDDLGVAANMSDFDLAIEKLDVVFSADLEGEEGFEDVDGSIDIEGNAPQESFLAALSLSGLDEANDYSWALFEGTCAAEGDIVGEAEDYPELEVEVNEEEETSAFAEADVNVRIFVDSEIHVRVFQGNILFDDDLVVCGQIN